MKATNATALCQAHLLPDAPAGQAPEWVHLLPAGTVSTFDGRGPYRVKDAAQLASASLQAAAGRMPIDENHSTDLAAPQGLPAPARGWMVELQSREDGIWGRVEWTDEGQQLVTSKAYRGISPVIVLQKDGRISAILRASLVNQPNLRGLTALHAQENNMEILAKLRKLLGLADDADETAVMAACEKLKAPDNKPALQAQLAPIAKAVGLKDDADQAAVLQAITSLSSKPNAGVEALQAELRTVTTTLNSLQSSVSTEKATTFVDAAIKAGRVGVKALRDHYIAMHAIDAARVEKEINAMPILTASGALPTPPAADKDGKIALNAEQLNAAKVLGIDPEKYRETLQAEQAQA
jgi:phage I-like protein